MWNTWFFDYCKQWCTRNNKFLQTTVNRRLRALAAPHRCLIIFLSFPFPLLRQARQSRTFKFPHIESLHGILQQVISKCNVPYESWSSILIQSLTENHKKLKVRRRKKGQAWCVHKCIAGDTQPVVRICLWLSHFFENEGAEFFSFSS